MYTYRLTDITFSDSTTLKPGHLTILLGPNNVGKSKALRDIVEFTTSLHEGRPKVVTHVEWQMPKSISEVSEVYDVEREYTNNNWIFHTLAPRLVGEHSQSGGPKWPEEYVERYDPILSQGGISARSIFLSSFGTSMVGFLTTEDRLQLVKETASASREGQSANPLQVLYNRGSAIEDDLNAVIEPAFGQRIKLDYTTPQQLRLRVGHDFSHIPSDPRDARLVLSGYEKLDDQGDGIRSFVGVVVAILAVKRPLFLIDEPEAFLHPPQAYRVGEFLADSASNCRQLIVATHSVDVLRGILNKRKDVDILRLDRVGEKNLIRHLEADRLRSIVNDPLLSSARVLDGLFYTGAVVVEADSDARFYQIAAKKRRSDLDLHFVNADNKQTVSRILRLYKDMGVRNAGIVDIDVLNDSREFRAQLETLGVTSENQENCLTARDIIARTIDDTPLEIRIEGAKKIIPALVEAIANFEHHGSAEPRDTASLLKTIDQNARALSESTKLWKQVKERGKAALTPAAATAFDQLSEICARAGLFVNPGGELESLLSEFGILHTTDKRAWIRQALLLLPSLEVNDEKQPWKFMKVVLSHLQDEKDAPPMFPDYIREAMALAKYEPIENGRFFGTVPPLTGLWAEDATLEACREELQSTLEDWIMIKMRFGDKDFPVLNGIDLNPKPEYAETD